MDFSEANCEPFCLYIESHERLNNFVKIGSAALTLLKQTTEISARASEIEDLVRQPTEPWGPIWHTNFPTLSHDAQIYLAGLAVVDAFSAFDHFLTGVKADFDRWNAANKMTSGTGSWRDQDGDISLQGLYKMYGWGRDAIEPYMPLFDFFQQCRNCLAHRSGWASRKLCDVAAGPELAACIEDWPFSRRNELLPDLPRPSRNSRIELAPKHAILASATCYRIANDVNARFVKHLGEVGMIFLAAHYALIDDSHPARLPHYKAPETALTHFLHDRFRVRDVDHASIWKALRSIGIDDRVRERYAELQL